VYALCNVSAAQGDQKAPQHRAGGRVGKDKIGLCVNGLFTHGSGKSDPIQENGDSHEG
jgi:hypothetical protein